MSPSFNPNRRPPKLDAETFDEAATVSSAVDCDSSCLVGIVLPTFVSAFQNDLGPGLVHKLLKQAGLK